MKRWIAAAVVFCCSAIVVAATTGEHITVTPAIQVGSSMGPSMFSAENDGTLSLEVLSTLGRDPSCTDSDPGATPITAAFTNHTSGTFTFPPTAVEPISATCPVAGPSMQGFGIRRCTFLIDKDTGEGGGGETIASFTEICLYQTTPGIAGPPSLTFDDVMVMSGDMKGITLTPSSQVGELYFSIVDADGVFGVVGPCSGAHCTAAGPFLMSEPIDVDISCTPPEVGTFNAQLYVVADTGIHHTVQLTCHGVDDGTGGMGNVNVNTPIMLSAPKGLGAATTITLMNNGTGPLHITDIFPSAGSSPDWDLPSISAPCDVFPCDLPAGDMVSIDVTFNPMSISNQGILATYIIDSDDPDDPMAQIDLIGTGEGSTLELVTNVDPTPFHIGTAPIGTPVMRSVTFANTPATDGIMVTPNVTGSSWFDVGTQLLNLSPDAMDSFVITCTPTSATTETATFTASANSTDGSPISFEVSCTGQTGNLMVNPTTIALGDVPAGSGRVVRTVTMTTTGAPLAVEAIEDLPDEAEVTFGQPSSGQVQDGIPVTFAVNFDPGALGPVETSISVRAGGQTRTIAFSANVVNDASGSCTTVAGAAPGTIDFGSVEVRQSAPAETLTITNNCTTGMLLLSDPTITPSGEFVLVGTALPASLAPGQSAALAVTFSPQTNGARMARLAIPTSTGEVGIDLIGTGLGDGTTFGAPASLYACDCSSSNPQSALVILLALAIPLVPRRRRRC